MVRSQEPLRAFQLMSELGLHPVVFPLPPMDVPDWVGAAAQEEQRKEGKSGVRQGSKAAARAGNMLWAVSPLEARRLALYAAFFLPLADSWCTQRSSSKKRSQSPGGVRTRAVQVITQIMGDELKLKTKDCCRVHLLLSGALAFQLMLRKTVQDPITRKNNRNVTPCRLEAGLTMRKVFACFACLVPALSTNHGNHCYRDTTFPVMMVAVITGVS
ncbi:unnamed protein product [Discosporangium mesarthrocarpum]